MATALSGEFQTHSGFFQSGFLLFLRVKFYSVGKFFQKQ